MAKKTALLRIYLEFALCVAVLYGIFAAAVIGIHYLETGALVLLPNLEYAASTFSRGVTYVFAGNFIFHPLHIIVWVGFFGVLIFAYKLPRIIRIPAFLGLFSLILLIGIGRGA